MPPKTTPLNPPAMHSQLSNYTLPEWAAIVGLVLVTAGLIIGACLG